jgi:gas vesicle protein
MGWFLLGTLIGAGVALLLTPKTGKEARELLSDRGSEWAKRAQELAGDLQVRAGELFEKSRELFEEQTQRLTSAFEAGREAMREEIGKSHRDG